MSTGASTTRGCRLCGRELPSTPIEHEEGELFCSTGCRDVYATLGATDASQGEDRSRGSEDGRREHPNDPLPTSEATRTFLRMDGMYSATCEAFLESRATDHEGVREAEASYVTETVRIDHDPAVVSKEALREWLSTLGYTAYLREDAEGDGGGPAGPTRRAREMTGMRKQRDEFFLEMRYIIGIVFGSFLMIPYVAILYPNHLAAIIDWAPLHVFQESVQLDSAGGFLILRLYFILTGLILVFTGLPVLRGAYISVKMRQPNTHLLVAITVLTAYVYSTLAVILGRSDIFFDLAVVAAAAVTAVMFYEASVKQRALSRLTELTVSQVDTAAVYADGETIKTPVAELTPQDRVLVRQGERIPIDGVLAEGTCTVDESVVTGESIPIMKQAGDEVLGGSVVTSDAAIIQVGEETTSSIERITRAVWAIQSAEHGVQRTADRLASRVVGIVGGAAILAGGVSFVLGTPAPVAVLVALSILLAGCPWAIGLATPLSVASTLEAALERGIIIFDETIFERLRDIDIVVFDKTGTLTTGEMDVIEADAPPALLEAAAALERRATHPAANAIVTAFAADDHVARPDGGRIDPPDETGDRVSEFTTHGNGIEGVVDGDEVLVGNLELFVEHGWTVHEELESRVVDARGFGRLPVIVGRDGEAEGIVILGDEPRSGWDETITRLGDRGIDVVVLTGDDEEATDFFRRHDAVTHVFSRVPPEGKTATIQRLRHEGEVAMVGDGTNDAPALAAADLGISLGSGTALAADAADIAITDEAINAVEVAFDIASTAHRRVRQNTGFALSYNAIALPAAAFGVFNPLVAVLALLVSGGLIAANSSRELIA